MAARTNAAQNLGGFLAANADLVLRLTRAVELADVSALIVEARRPVLFERIAGHPGWVICDLLFRDRRAQARVLGTTPDRVLPELARRLALPPRAPVMVDDGPVKSVRIAREAVDLRAIPAFRHGEKDPGPSLIAMMIIRDPETGRDNLSFTRIAAIDAHRATVLIGSSPHMRAILARHEAAGRPMPVALVIGTHPAYEIMASYSVPTHLEAFGELDMVANLLDAPVALVACDTIPLAVPAEAELVIEGEVRPSERAPDGPGSSQFLYYHPGAAEQPVFTATAITRRTSPVLRQHDTLLYTDHQTLIALPHEAILWQRLREHAFPLHDVQYVPWGGTLVCVVKMTPEYDGQVRDVLLMVLGQRWPNAKMALAVDDDIDIEELAELFWLISTRVDPARDVHIVPDTRGHPADPGARPLAEAPRRAITGKWLIDATKPPLSRAADRARFERALPPRHKAVRLEDYL
ncbi:MAG: UbiD family decarboxylase [Alphaproteobacteria bacterium]|nr:UbiD family decarboxylase [Alphaproteobacteria bacterium]